MRNSKKGLGLFSMIKLDFYRLFHTPALYIMLLIAAMIPALLMTTSGQPTVDQYGNMQPPAITYTNTWQVVESMGDSAAADNPLDFSGYANINMVFIFAGLLMSIFVAHDYSSGFVKNIFTVHSRKRDYVISKTLVGTFGGIGMLITYIFGAVISAIFTGMSFEVNIGGLIFCILSKALLLFVFSSLFLGVAVFFKNKLWLTIVFTFLFGMMLYPAGSIATLSSTPITLMIALIAGLIGSVLIGSVSTAFLSRRDLL